MSAAWFEFVKASQFLSKSIVFTRVHVYWKLSAPLYFSISLSHYLPLAHWKDASCPLQNVITAMFPSHYSCSHNSSPLYFGTMLFNTTKFANTGLCNAHLIVFTFKLSLGLIWQIESFLSFSCLCVFLYLHTVFSLFSSLPFF